MKCRDFGIRSLERISLTAENSNTLRISGNTLNWMFWNTLQHQQHFLARLAPKYLSVMTRRKDIIFEAFLVVCFVLVKCFSQPTMVAKRVGTNSTISVVFRPLPPPPPIQC